MAVRGFHHCYQRSPSWLSEDSIRVEYYQKQLVCKFHQYGHCKFGSHCMHFHTKDTCPIHLCNHNSCEARHPKPCLYFSRNSYCKFGSSCLFLHSSPAPSSCQLQDDILNFKDNLQLVITSLNINEIELMTLEEKGNELEKELEAKDCTSAVSFQYDSFEYYGSSKTVLKHHKSIKHKKETNNL